MDCNSQNLGIFLAHQLECKSVWSVLEINASHRITSNLSFAFPILTCKLNFLWKNQNRQVAVSIFLVIARILNNLFHWDVDVGRFCVDWQVVFTNSNWRPEGSKETFKVCSIRDCSQSSMTEKWAFRLMIFWRLWLTPSPPNRRRRLWTVPYDVIKIHSQVFSNTMRS